MGSKLPLLVLGAALLLSCFPDTEATFYDHTSPGPKQWYFPKIEFTKKVTKYTKPCLTAPGLSPTQPGCTLYYSFWGYKDISICAACAEPAYVYTFSTGHIPVCQCAKNYARNSTGHCVWVKLVPAPPPVYKPPYHPTPVVDTPWHGGYGWHKPHDFPPIHPKDPHYNFYQLCKQLFTNQGGIFYKLFGKVNGR